MSALALTLLGLAAWLAERGSRSARRGRLGLDEPAWIPPRAGAAVGCTVRRRGPAGRVAGVAVGLHRRRARVGDLRRRWRACVLWRLRERRRVRAADAARDEQLVDAVASIAAAIRAGRPCHRRSRSPPPRRARRCEARCAGSIARSTSACRSTRRSPPGPATSTPTTPVSSPVCSPCTAEVAVTSPPCSTR